MVPIALRLAVVQAKHYKAIPVDNVVSVTGAGDSFVAAAVCTPVQLPPPALLSSQQDGRQRLATSLQLVLYKVRCNALTV